ncbi:YdcF family protein [Frisingicoccus sp.]|uniref:YdcF family protein n=1 Tax=Frisingicoccus sp. TaxID=1918627 RepID=UPI003AB7130F
MKKKRIFPVMLGIFLLLAIYLAATALSIWQYASVDEKQSADTAIVLGAGTADGEISLVFRERIHHGIWLYQNGYVDTLIFTGGVGEGNARSDAWVAGQYAIEQGVPAEHILLEEESVITQENIANAKKIMDEKGYRTAIIVSDPLHMKRAMLMARDYGIEAYSSPTPTSRYISLKTKIPFLAREEFFYIGYKVYRMVGR